MDFFLRPFRMGDAQSIQFYANNPRVAQNLRNGFACPFTMEHAVSLIKMFTEAPAEKVLARAVCVDDVAVGSIGVFVLDDVYYKTADIAYWLGERYWGKGIMAKAIQIICAQAFSQLDIVRIQAEPFFENKASQRALDKAGFVMEGTLHSRVYKNGHIQDALMYALLRK